MAREMFMAQPMVLEVGNDRNRRTLMGSLQIEPPVVVFGDIHGQLADLFAHFDNVGWPGVAVSFVAIRRTE